MPGGLGSLPLAGLLTSTPIIAITLRRNLGVLFQIAFGWELKSRASQLGLVLLAILPPFAVGACTTSIDLVIHVTGSYGGCLIMFVFPTVLAWAARRKLNQIHVAEDQQQAEPSAGSPLLQRPTNPHASPLQHPAWVWGVLAWSALVLLVNTASFIRQAGA